MKSQEEKQKEALIRQEARDNRTAREQLAIVKRRPGKNLRETAVLKARAIAEKKARNEGPVE